MLDLAKAQCADFSPCLNQDFEIATDGAPLVLKLSDARPLGTVHRVAEREPFMLTFRGPAPLRLSQGIYKMNNATVGEMEVFLVQIAADETSSTFEAVFN